jgi:hypothetical protein
MAPEYRAPGRVSPIMRALVPVLVGVAASTAAAEPKPEAVSVVPVDVDFCEDCNLVSQDKVPGVGTVEVWATKATSGDSKLGGDKPLYDLIVLIVEGSKKVGVHLVDYRAGMTGSHRSWAVRESHRVNGFHEGVVTDRKATPHDAVAVMFDVARKRIVDDGKSAPATFQDTLVLACGHPGAWACSVVRLDGQRDHCKITRWDPPVVDYACDGQLTLKSHP